MQLKRTNDAIKENTNKLIGISFANKIYRKNIYIEFHISFFEIINSKDLMLVLNVFFCYFYFILLVRSGKKAYVYTSINIFLLILKLSELIIIYVERAPSSENSAI